MSDIYLGQKVRDVVTKLEGIAVSRIVYLNGCVQFGIKPVADGGKDNEVQYIDATQIEVMSQGIRRKLGLGVPGGPQRDAPKP